MKKSLVFIWWLKSLAYICTQETKQKQNEHNEHTNNHVKSRRVNQFN